MNIRRTLRLGALSAALLAIAAVLAACGSGGSSSDSSTGSGQSSSGASATAIKRDPANAGTTIVVGSKNFTEQKVLGEVYAQALKAAGYNVKTALNLGDEKTALKALKDGQIDGYPEYTGTALLSFFNVPTDKLPHDPKKAYDEVKADFAKQGIAALSPTPFTSSNEVGLTQEKAKQLGVTKISDLAGKSQD